MLQIYHNPNCSKSQACILKLESDDADFEIIDYIENPLDFDELKLLLSKLRIPALALVRQKEPEWQAFSEKALLEDEIISILVKHPVLIERPIAVNGDKAVIARPLERIDEIR